MNSYYGLRDYGTDPLAWGGKVNLQKLNVVDERGIPRHAHEWGPAHTAGWHVGTKAGIATSTLNNSAATHQANNKGTGASMGSVCPCGAWLGSLGLEPTPELFIAHLVEVFREVRRVLRPNGTLWCNLGDSYAGSGKGPTGHNGIGNHDVRQGFIGTSQRSKTDSGIPGFKPKDLMMMPARLAMALQADGWYLRSMIPWLKRNSMPESVTDRPATSLEYVFLLSKQKTYYWDADAVRVAQSENNHGLKAARERGYSDPGSRPKEAAHGSGTRANGSFHASKPAVLLPSGRNRRNTDWFFESWQGLMLDEHDDPLALVVNPMPFRGSHFACVDAETEALTPDGWRRHDELKDGDVIAAYNQTQLGIRWEQATFHRYPFDGDLVAIEKRDTSQRLTPNHRCLIRRRGGAPTVVRADELTPGMEVMTASDWAAGEWMTIGPDWAALLGWYIAEGENRYPGMVRIHQSMTANPDHVRRIRGLLDRLAAVYSVYERHRDWRGRDSHEITFSVSRDVARRLQALAPAKTMTPGLAMLVQADAEALLNAMIDGDGHRRADGRACIVQKDKTSIDAMQMLALRLGYRAHVGRHGKDYTLYLTKGDWLTLRSTNGQHLPIAREPYVGIVWCPSVPSMFWFARRNGKPFVTGNTFPPKLVEPMVKASTSEKGQCPECGAPWMRVVEKDEALAESRRGDDDYGSRGLEAGNRFASKTPGYTSSVQTVGWRASCAHSEAAPVPQTVLDPFAGAGTVSLVADRLGRNSIGIDLKPEYADMASSRIVGDSPMFVELTA